MRLTKNVITFLKKFENELQVKQDSKSGYQFRGCRLQTNKNQTILYVIADL